MLAHDYRSGFPCGLLFKDLRAGAGGRESSKVPMPHCSMQPIRMLRGSQEAMPTRIWLRLYEAADPAREALTAVPGGHGVRRVNEHELTQAPVDRALLVSPSQPGSFGRRQLPGIGHVFQRRHDRDIVLLLGFGSAGAAGSVISPLVSLAAFLRVAVTRGVSEASPPIAGPGRASLALDADQIAVILLAAVLAGHRHDDGPANPVTSVIALLRLGHGGPAMRRKRAKVADLTTPVLTMTLTGLAGTPAGRRERPRESSAPRRAVWRCWVGRRRGAEC